MRIQHKHLGDGHVRLVHQAILDFLTNQSINHYPETVLQTVHYILDNYPNIIFVTSKFSKDKPDKEKDLILYMENGNKININLFLIKRGGKIQPKNPGAKSFFSKYFLSKELQENFNENFDRLYIDFLKELLTLKIGTHYISDMRELKKLVLKFFPRFTDQINPVREIFLYNLRELCFSLLKDYYNRKNKGFLNAYKSFFMTDDVNIITSYLKNEDDVNVTEFNPGTPNFSDIQIYKRGKNTVGIKFGEVALTLRFKFESSPNSSIKLASSYDSFPERTERKLVNSNTLQKMVDMLTKHKYINTSNSSNAVGKCHEAISYYYFLKEYPETLQVEPDECVVFLEKYSSLVKSEVLQKLFESSSTLVPVIREKLNEKYNSFTLESIELVPDSYITDKLDTGDLQLTLKVNDKYVLECISLKALAKKSSKITTKNPGIGTILGPTYFNLGSIKNVVSDVKEKFHVGEISHKESLEILSKELGLRLSKANQDQLKQGVESLLGKAMMAITFYDEHISYCKEHSIIDTLITVYLNKPTDIQNTLAWNNDRETISLRVKFSRGQKHGWSTIKLTSEYQFR